MSALEQARRSLRQLARDYDFSNVRDALCHDSIERALNELGAIQGETRPDDQEVMKVWAASWRGEEHPIAVDAIPEPTVSSPGPTAAEAQIVDATLEAWALWSHPGVPVMRPILLHAIRAAVTQNEKRYQRLVEAARSVTEHADDQSQGSQPNVEDLALALATLEEDSS